jgi:hypothetical protein
MVPIGKRESSDDEAMQLGSSRQCGVPCVPKKTGPIFESAAERDCLVVAMHPFVTSPNIREMFAGYLARPRAVRANGEFRYATYLNGVMS